MMTATDKATLLGFYETNLALTFDWTHPLTSVTYTVFFDDDDISCKHVSGFSDYWSVTIKLVEV